jgi:hypothetical protein
MNPAHNAHPPKRKQVDYCKYQCTKIQENLSGIVGQFSPSIMNQFSLFCASYVVSKLAALAQALITFGSPSA